MLLDALADYHAQAGEWEGAEKCWRASPVQEPLFHSAACRLVQLQAIRGRHYAAAGQAALSNRRAPSGAFELMLPKNQKARDDETHKRLLKYDVALERVVPKKEFWRYGMQPKSQEP